LYGGIGGSNINAGLIESSSSDIFIYATWTNSGIIQDNGGLILFDGKIYNTGNIITANGAGIILNNSSIDDSKGGTITPLSGLQLQGGGILGGSTTLAAGGNVLVSDGGNVDTPASVLSGTITNQGTISIYQSSTLVLSGIIKNSGEVILIDAGRYTGQIVVDTYGISLSGGGRVDLGDSGSGGLTNSGGGQTTITNVDNTISGSGLIGSAMIQLINQKAATIDANGSHALDLVAGSNTIINAGMIEATGMGGLVIQGIVANSGTIEANGGTVTVSAAVTGSGSAVIATGTITFAAAFNQNVTFTGATGELVLAQSQAYTRSIAGFSVTGGTSLDLRDIAFTNPGEATFKGTTKGGMLTVSDGTHTANIKLVGDYTASTFTASSDGNGGVLIVDPPKAGAQIFPACVAISAQQPFIAALASFGAPSPAAVYVAIESHNLMRPTLLANLQTRI
jgi:hypothetical protein